MTSQDIARRRLLSQRLIGSPLESARDAVEWLGAVQAQDYAGAKWGLGLRVSKSHDADIEQAFTIGAILRTHALRPTWHFIAPADIRWVLDLTGPRVHAANAPIYRKLGLDRTAFKRSNTTLRKTLQGGRQLSRDELREALRRNGVPVDEDLRMAYLMMHAELEGIVCSGPRRGKQFTYMLLEERVPPGKSMARKDSLVELASRFFRSRGPATAQDFAKWSGLTVADARSGLEGAASRLECETIEKKTYWLAPTKDKTRRPASPTAHLLSIYDEYVSGYKDRSAMITPAHAARISAMGNAATSILILDGRVAGTWKRRFVKGAVDVQFSLFRRLKTTERRAVTAAVERYGAYLQMDAVQE